MNMLRPALVLSVVVSLAPPVSALSLEIATSSVLWHLSVGASDGSTIEDAQFYFPVEWNSSGYVTFDRVGVLNPAARISSHSIAIMPTERSGTLGSGGIPFSLSVAAGGTDFVLGDPVLAFIGGAAVQGDGRPSQTRRFSGTLVANGEPIPFDFLIQDPADGNQENWFSYRALTETEIQLTMPFTGVGIAGGPIGTVDGVSYSVGLSLAWIEPAPMSFTYTASPLSSVPLFVGLGHLPGDTNSLAFAISADGQTVVGASGTDAFRWSLGHGLTALGGTARHANDVSGDGSVIVGLQSPQEAFRWTSAETSGLGLSTDATGVSADGAVVVGNTSTALREAFRWTETGGLVKLFPFSPKDNVALDVSADGSVVVGDYGNQPFVWRDDFGSILPFTGRADAVSGNGEVVVGQQDGLAFRWTEPTGLEPLGSGEAFAASFDGSVIVGVSGSGGAGSRAFIWTAGDGMLDLAELLTTLGTDLDGWTLLSAFDVSADGRAIVGVGLDPNGHQQAWLVVVPEPSSPISIIAGLSVLSLGCRRAGRVQLRSPH